MATDYANPGGTGDRRAIIAVASYPMGMFTGGDINKLVDGANDNSLYFTDSIANNEGCWIRFDFGVGVSKIIDEFKWIQQSDLDKGIWKFQGSNDSFAWTDVSGDLDLVTAASTTHSFSNSTGYRFYRLLGVSGTRGWNPYIYEVEFKIDAGEYVEPDPNVTSYLNPGGMEDRRAIITLTASDGLFAGTASNLIDGVFADNLYFASGAFAVSGHWIKFDFGEGASKIIDEFAWFQKSYQDEGNWKFQGSNNDSTWTDLTEAEALVTAATTTHSFTNTTGYRYYRILGDSGWGYWNPYLYEVMFKIADSEGDPDPPAGTVPGLFFANG